MTLIRLGDAQADLSLRWAHMPFCWFCHEAAQMVTVTIPWCMKHTKGIGIGLGAVIVLMYNIWGIVNKAFIIS